MTEREEPKHEAARAGDPVGLGTVVANPAGLGRSAADEPLLDEASEESFPASDPPATGASGRFGTGPTGRPSA